MHSTEDELRCVPERINQSSGVRGLFKLGLLIFGYAFIGETAGRRFHASQGVRIRF